MSSWWRKIAEANSITGTHGSWKRRVAEALFSPFLGQTGSWPRIMTESGATINQDNGSWTRRLTPTDAPYGQSWARKLALAEGIPGVPTYAVVNRDGAFVVNRDGAYVVADPTPRAS